MRAYGPADVIIHSQPETAVFVNAKGQVVIRQADEHDHDADNWLVFSAEHIPALISALTEIAPHAGFRQLEDDDEPADEPQPVHEPPPQPPDLREQIIEALRAGGKSKRQIAAEVGCSEATVRRIAATLGATLSATPVRLACDSDAPMPLLFGPSQKG